MRKNVVTIASTSFIFVTAWSTWWLLLPIYLRELRASELWVGISYTLMDLAFAFSSVIGGFLGDRFGRKQVVVIPTFCFFPLFLLASQTQDWQFFVILLILAEFGYGLQNPCFTSIIAESATGTRMGTAFGITGVAFSLGLVVGPFLGSLLLHKIGIPSLILWTAITALVCGGLRMIGLIETKTTIHLTLSKISFNKNLILLLLGSICVSIVFSLTSWGPFIALYAKDSIGLLGSDINLLFAIGWISSGIFSVLGGRVIDKIGGKPVFIAGAILHPFCFIPWLFTRSVASGAPFFVFAYLFSQSAYIAHQVLISGFTSRQIRARVIGVFGAITGIIASFAPAFGMLIKINFGGGSPFLLAMTFGIIGAIFLLFTKPMRRNSFKNYGPM